MLMAVAKASSSNGGEVVLVSWQSTSRAYREGSRGASGKIVLPIILCLDGGRNHHQAGLTSHFFLNDALW